MKDKKSLIILGVVGLASILMVTGYVLISNTTTPPTQTAIPSTPVTDRAVQLSLNSTPRGVELWLQSDGQSIDLATLGLDLTFSADSVITPTQSTPSIDQAISQTSWSFPFSRFITNQDGSVSLNMSAVYASPQPYSLSARTLLATLPLDAVNGGNVSISMNTENTQATNKDNQPVPVQLTTNTITLE